MRKLSYSYFLPGEETTVDLSLTYWLWVSILKVSGGDIFESIKCPVSSERKDEMCYFGAVLICFTIKSNK